MKNRKKTHTHINTRIQLIPMKRRHFDSWDAESKIYNKNHRIMKRSVRIREKKIFFIQIIRALLSVGFHWCDHLSLQAI